MKYPILIATFLAAAVLVAQSRSPFEEFNIYGGSTHAHTAYTWSHGEQFAKGDCAGIVVFNKDPNSPTHGWSDGYVKTKQDGCPGIFVIDAFQYPSNNMKVRADWQEVQGPPAKHYALAKQNGYDFYTVTDHSQEVAFNPARADNPLWVAAKNQAKEATDSKFVAIPGFEFSENDGPGGTGHINVMNTEGMLNALAPGVDLPHFYKWLAAEKSNGDGPVVASFNHPGPDSYANFADRDPQVTEILTMLEVINSNNKIHYAGFLKALDKGWKVSPVCGNDNHGLTGITKQKSRTFVLARARTKAEILDAMKNHRTYASMDGSLQCKYTVNGAIMGSTLKPSGGFQFDVRINGRDKITKLDIVKDGGAVVQQYEPTSGETVKWTPTVQDASAHYFFIRVWTAKGGDAPGAKPENPVAWLAPVWIER